MNVKTRVAPLALIVVASGLGSQAQRGSAPPPVRPVPQPLAREMAAEYRQLIARYLAGEPDAAVAIATTWRVASVEAIQDVQPWDRSTLRAAAMLETDVALSRAREAIRKFGWPVRQSRATIDMGSRLTLALRWLDLADNIRPADKSPFRKRWQLAVGRRLLWDGFVLLADVILGDASLLYSSDPDVLFAYGTLRESAAQRFTANLGPAIKAGAGPFDERIDRAELIGNARNTLARAVNASPKLEEARLRLAHVHLLQRGDRTAAPLLDRVRSSRPSTDVAYLAALMLGGIRTRQNDRAAAATLFQEARQLEPAAQSAYIAEAHALHAAGRVQESIETLRAMLSRPMRTRDPWARYPYGLDETRASLDALRDEVGQQRSPAVPDARAISIDIGHPGATFEVTRDDPSDRVALDVLVTRDHRPAIGLTAADFDVRHDDERQRVEVSEIQSLPVDVRIMVDTGNGLEGERAARVKEAARAVVEYLRPGDRGQVLTFSEDVRLAAGLTSDRTLLNAAIDRLAAAPGVALIDATFVSLALPATPGRRALSLMFTAGLDTSSWLAPTSVVETAAGAPVTVYAVIVPDPDLPLRQQQLDGTRMRKWLFEEPELMRDGFLTVIAEETGGEILHAATNADLAATFTEAVSRFQQRYRLTYTPVKRDRRATQTIEVLMKDKNLKVTARKR